MRHRWQPLLSGVVITTLLLPSATWSQQTFGNELNNGNNRYGSAQDPFNRYSTPRYSDNSNRDNNRDINDRSRGGSSIFGSNRDGVDSNNVNREFGDRDATSTDRTFNVGGNRNRDRTSFSNPFASNRGGPNTFYDTNTNVMIKDATYFIIASRMVRPGAIYRVFVTVTDTPKPLTVRASIARDGVEMSADSKDIKANVPETLLMRVPPTSVPGEYKLKVEGTYNTIMGGIAFVNETIVAFSQRSMTIFVQTDKPVYMQGEMVRFRTIPITTELKGFDNAIDVYMIDPNGHIMRRWLSRQSNLGSVSLNYKLSDQPVYGEWRVRIIAQGQVEEGKFEVEEYYQTRFEVNVTMPAFFFNTDPFIYGRIMANFTSGAPVFGNLTLKATIRPIGSFNPRTLNQFYRVGHLGYQRDDEQTRNYNQRYNPELNSNPYGPSVDQNIDQRYQSNVYQDQYVVERTFNFDEEWPFWVEKPETVETYDRWGNTYRNQLPYLRFFNGTYEFKFPMVQLEELVPSLAGMEVLITAKVGERYYDEIIEGYSIARIYNSSVKVAFLGDSPQIFKPMMPFSVYIVAEYHDGSPLPIDKLITGNMEISGQVEGRSGRRDFPTQLLQMSEKPGIWELKVDLRNDLQLDESKASRDFLNDIQQMRFQANFIDLRGERASAELVLMAHHSPQNQHIKVSTSTQNAKVGEYIIFHVQSNFHIQNFHYLVMSKGLVLLTGLETMKGGIRTLSVTLSAEMAPVASIVVWHMGQYGNIVADSLTFPVNGISRNNFTFYINNRKARTGEKVEVAIFGEPGAYVGLSGIDSAFYTMQAGNELTYAKVITKMSTFDEQTNGTFKHTWISHQGDPDELVYFPASTFGVDANRTFEYAGLVVFTDGIVPRRFDTCAIQGQSECLNGRCYRPEKKCDGFRDCEDNSDELGCDFNNQTMLTEFRKYRFNRIQRHYDNVWLWRDVNIGPHGRYIFTLDVPDVPARWMVSAFSVSPSLGYGMITRPVEYVGVQPFFINVEMPSKCRQGEQVGVRVTVFNYMTNAIEATVVLHGSPDYKFVHVDAEGIVRSYNPRTSFGEHQFFVYLPAQESTIVYLPIVPTRLGDISITVHAATLLGKDEVTRKLHVEADGLPQYRHQSILLDLSSRAYVFQYMHVNVTETPIIPYEVDRYYVYGSNKATISVVGDVVGPIFPTMPVNATSLIHLPMDSAEQNMFSFAANFYTMMYMRLINQRNKTTYKHAFHHLNVGYQRQLSYLRPDGSYSLFRSDFNQSDSSVWLTAYCARVFQEANFYEWENFIYIDPKVIQKNVAWLLRYQTKEGSFYETTWSPDRKANESSRFPHDQNQRNISLTAHVLITLASVRDLSGNLGGKVALATQRAITYLDRNLLGLKTSGSSYEIAIVAYALMLAKAPNAEQAFRYLSDNMKQIGEFAYWGDDDLPLPPYKQENQKPFSLPRLPYANDAKNIETTAYGLLTYVSRQEILVEAIVRWLNSQRLTDGGWASTQDTGIAMKALIEYTVRSRIRDVSSLSITVEATALQDQSTTFHINDNNLAQLQTLEIPNAWGTVKVQAKGAGYAILQMSVQYNVDIEEYQTKPPVPAFELYPNARFHGRNQSHITYTSCQRWTNLDESIRSGMAVLDVTIPTGYIIQQQKLDAYILSRRVRNLQRARFQESKVLFYFDYLDHDSVCVNFTVERWFPVANMSRYLPIRVYDYYAPERFNESIFDALPTYLLNICEVCGSSQCPYCSIYNAAFKSPVSIVLLIASITVVLARHFRLVDHGRSWFDWND